jgi:hypothetical protein
VPQPLLVFSRPPAAASATPNAVVVEGAAILGRLTAPRRELAIGILRALRDADSADCPEKTS